MAHFLVFAVYMVGAMRSRPLRTRGDYVLTHESIASAKTAPPTSPLRRLASCARSQPAGDPPGDGNENSVLTKCGSSKPPRACWPSAASAWLTRRTASAAQVAKGRYVLEDCDAHGSLILIELRHRTGSLQSRRRSMLSAEGQESAGGSRSPAVELFLRSRSAVLCASRCCGRRA